MEQAPTEQAPTEQAKASSAVANGPVPAHLTLKPTLPPTDEELLALEVKIAELDAERSQYSPVGPIIVMGIGYGAAAYAAFALLSEALAGDEECGSPSDEGRYTGSCKDPNRPPTGLVIGVGAVGTGMLLGGGAWLGYRLVKRRDIGAQLETLHKAREERVKLPPAPAPRDELGALVRAGRLSAGPWVTQMDEFLVSGESHVRNLELGLERARQLGGALEVGYMPDQFGHIGQMPQILRLAGIDRAVVWRGVPSAVPRDAAASASPSMSKSPQRNASASASSEGGKSMRLKAPGRPTTSVNRGGRL